jgi:hypothetical protein
VTAPDLVERLRAEARDLRRLDVLSGAALIDEAADALDAATKRVTFLEKVSDEARGLIQCQSVRVGVRCELPYLHDDDHEGIADGSFPRWSGEEA